MGLLYNFICPRLQMAWFIKLPITFCCNLVMAMVLVLVLQKIYKLEGRFEAEAKKVFKKYILYKVR